MATGVQMGGGVVRKEAHFRQLPNRLTGVAASQLQDPTVFGGYPF